ncbi:MAG: hypothetical protein ACLP8A_12135 [Methylovirgula sp.]
MAIIRDRQGLGLQRLGQQRIDLCGSPASFDDCRISGVDLNQPSKMCKSLQGAKSCLSQSAACGMMPSEIDDRTKHSAEADASVKNG